MKITYDPEADALYICLREGVEQVTGVPVSRDVVVDLGTEEEIVGIEVLRASYVLGEWVKRARQIEVERAGREAAK